MPWNKTLTMDQKMQFIADYLKELFSFTELCERYGISRKTRYKWVNRYLRDGPAELDDRKRAPHQIPHKTPQKTPQKIIDALLEERCKHPTWGAGKHLKKVQDRHSSRKLPVRSAVHTLLKPYGVFKKRCKRRYPGHPGKSQKQAHQPNDIWCCDFKGHFRMDNGKYCYPLTITDQHSRFLLACQSLPSVAKVGVKPVFTRDSVSMDYQNTCDRIMVFYLPALQL